MGKGRDSNKETEEEGSEGVAKKSLIGINGGELYVNPFYINSLRKTQTYNDKRLALDYCIIINETSDDKSRLWYANTVVKFVSLQQRNEELRRLRELLESYGIQLVDE